jgi:bifunctional non-homologous end joining protein LigD
MTRYPDGITGKSFFQKDAPSFAPGWIRLERIWSEHAEREIDYFVCDDLETLLYVANLGSIPLHVWASRVAAPERPDWCILDLDPKGAPFEHVVRLALEIRALTTAIGLPAFIKTSGASGLHVLLPLGRQCTYEQSRTLGELLARVVVAAQPEIATITRQVEARGGRVYIDYLQNGHGRLLVGPFSVRPLPKAPVSMPLEWEEVGPDLDPRAFTIKSAPERLARQAVDPLLAVLALSPDLPSVLERLAQRLSAAPPPSK